MARGFGMRLRPRASCFIHSASSSSGGAPCPMYSAGSGPSSGVQARCAATRRRRRGDELVVRARGTCGSKIDRPLTRLTSREKLDASSVTPSKLKRQLIAVPVRGARDVVRTDSSHRRRSGEESKNDPSRRTSRGHLLGHRRSRPARQPGRRPGAPHRGAAGAARRRSERDRQRRGYRQGRPDSRRDLDAPGGPRADHAADYQGPEHPGAAVRSSAPGPSACGTSSRSAATR